MPDEITETQNFEQDSIPSQPSPEATAGTASTSEIPLESTVQQAEPASNGIGQPEYQTAQIPPNEPFAKLSLLAKARETIQFRKRRKLEKIMSMFLNQRTITNDKVEKLLHVSDATATRYLDQLEKEGKVKQEGRTGKSVSYFRI